MKKLVVKNQADCMACRACEVACSKAFYKVFNQDLSCIRIVDNGKGRAKVQTCIQCGKCAKVCDQGAITQNAKGTYVVDKKKCIGCGKCVEACPMNVMVLDPTIAISSKCIACGICAKACPMQILEVVEV